MLKSVDTGRSSNWLSSCSLISIPYAKSLFPEFWNMLQNTKGLLFMQELGPVWRFCCQNHTEYPILGKEYPSRFWTSHGGLQFWTYQEYTSPKNGISHAGLRDFSSELTKILPQDFGTSHGIIRDFNSELTKNTPHHKMELLMEDLGTLVLSLQRISPHMWNFL